MMPKTKLTLLFNKRTSTVLQQFEQTLQNGKDAKSKLGQTERKRKPQTRTTTMDLFHS
jgi:hypothetical protein